MYRISVQRAHRKAFAPSASSLKQWAMSALKNRIQSAELTIRIVNLDEMTQLNTEFRKKSGPTNVLSFPFDMPEECDLEIPLLGDIVICSDVVNQEATQQQKETDAHWAHMVVHGTLHLLGYDHENNEDAIIMETEEITILKTAGFDNPYTEKQETHGIR